jgi:hypothetical protein
MADAQLPDIRSYLSSLAPRWVSGKGRPFFLVEQAALRRDGRMAFDEDVRDQHHRGYGLYIFTRRALKLLDGLCSPE